MKNKNKTHLSFYQNYIKTGELPEGGLCCCHGIDQSLLDLFVPTEDDVYKLEREHLSTVWWGSLANISNNHEKQYSFTPMRQTIVLFMAAMNNEL